MDERVWSFVVLLLALVPWVCYLFVIFFFTVSLLYGRFKLHHSSHPPVDNLPGVSILKPLMGVDPYLEFNLESHFNIQYPKFELLFCVEDSMDPAIEVVKTLQNRYPHVDSHIFTGGKQGVINPLVFNMAPGYDSSKYDVIWVSTSRILANTEILVDMISKLQQPNTALVHQIPFTTDQPGFTHAVEKVYFGSSVARFNLAFHVLGVSCFTGMSYLVKKDELEKLKGLSFFGKFLAEDFFLAKYLHEKGFRHKIAAVPAQQNVSNISIISYKDRLVRWMRLRLNMIPFITGLFEPLISSIFLGIMASASVYYLISVNPYLWFSVHLLVWSLLDYVQLRLVQNGPLPFSMLTYFSSWLVSEMLFVFIYFEAIINPCRITWGKRTYKLSRFGRSIEITNNRSILPL